MLRSQVQQKIKENQLDNKFKPKNAKLFDVNLLQNNVMCFCCTGAHTIPIRAVALRRMKIHLCRPVFYVYVRAEGVCI